MGTIVVGLDGSVHGKTAAEWAAPVAEKLGAEMVIVHARGMIESEAHAQQVAESVHPDALVVDGDPVSALLRVAAERGAMMIVVGRRGSGTNPALLLGSTSHQLAERSPCPVVIIPPEVAGS